MSSPKFLRAFVPQLLLLLALGACHRDRCLKVCEQRQKELKCVPSESCKTTCDELHEKSACSAEMREWEDCIVSLPTDQWECNMRGQPVPKDKACPAARTKVFNCISKYPQWPMPKSDTKK